MATTEAYTESLDIFTMGSPTAAFDPTFAPGGNDSQSSLFAAKTPLVDDEDSEDEDEDKADKVVDPDDDDLEDDDDDEDDDEELDDELEDDDDELDDEDDEDDDEEDETDDDPKPLRVKTR